MSKKLTLDALRQLREDKQKELSKRDPANKDIQVIIGMGTCGIAAGAKNTFAAFLDILDAKNITNVLVRQTGCMGLCHSEPTVEVITHDMPPVIYGNVNKEACEKIISQHILEGKLVDDLICDRPAIDIIR
ncbi:MAG: (2Fe-2S) ferredoxin domain-containing protein [Lentisphaerae bacterium]|jgi:NADP-reducing hydrogenase subunit HndB|nr:(2Fe-2S) ferredoxin domain-containing protein [Lentisphaerota bacterium]